MIQSNLHVRPHLVSDRGHFLARISPGIFHCFEPLLSDHLIQWSHYEFTARTTLLRV